jgi:hypothetical protein
MGLKFVFGQVKILFNRQLLNTLAILLIKPCCGPAPLDYGPSALDCGPWTAAGIIAAGIIAAGTTI